MSWRGHAPYALLLNHLTAARLQLDLLASGLPPAAEGARGAQAAIDKAGVVVRDSLEALRQQHEAPERASRLPVGAAIYDAVAGVQALAERRRVRLEVAVDDRGALAGALLVRAVENLLSNAVKFSPEGSVVEVQARPATGGTRIEVADRGPGVPEALREQLFERFRSGPRAPGWGLGLAIARRVVESEGGRIGFEDRPGGGSVFWIELPGAAPRAGGVLQAPAPGRG